MLSARELLPGQVHKAPIVAVENWGVLVDLGTGMHAKGGSGSVDGGTKALVTTIHQPTPWSTDVKKRWVGAKVNCRILTVEREAKARARDDEEDTVADATPPILSYGELMEKRPEEEQRSKKRKKKAGGGAAGEETTAGEQDGSGGVLRAAKSS